MFQAHIHTYTSLVKSVNCERNSSSNRLSMCGHNYFPIMLHQLLLLACSKRLPFGGLSKSSLYTLRYLISRGFYICIWPRLESRSHYNYKWQLIRCRLYSSNEIWTMFTSSVVNQSTSLSYTLTLIMPLRDFPGAVRDPPMFCSFIQCLLSITSLSWQHFHGNTYGV